MTEKEFIMITDVNSPYRDHLFSTLNHKLKKKNIAFKVYFMKSESKIRRWNNSLFKKNYKYMISNGLSFSLGMHEFHYNLDIIKYIFKNRKKCLFIIGGSWNSPTTLIISLLIQFKIFNKNNFYLWSESNYKSFIFKNSIIDFLRKFIFSKFVKFVVPSEMAIKSVKLILKTDKKINFFLLPNIVNEKKFTPEPSKIKYNKIIAFWPARLHENSKGIINFLKKVKKLILNNPNFRILIAGDGPDKNKINTFIKVNGLNKSVRLLGYLKENEIIKKYNESDFFLLPSLRDPCPLSVIEALWMSKPLLISDHCGNINEALISSTNGFSFDPKNSLSVETGLINMLKLPKNKLREFGHASRVIAKQKFKSDECIDNFLKKIKGI